MSAVRRSCRKVTQSPSSTQCASCASSGLNAAEMNWVGSRLSVIAPANAPSV